MEAPALSANAWLEQIRAAVAGEPDDATGWKTCEALADEWHLSREQAGRMLRKGEKAGKVERKKFRVMTGRGLYPTPHYRLK